MGAECSADRTRDTSQSGLGGSPHRQGSGEPRVRHPGRGAAWLAGLCVVWVAVATLLAPEMWVPSLMRELLPHTTIVTAAAAAWCLVKGRTWACFTCLLTCVPVGVMLLGGRADRADAAGHGAVIRVLQVNAAASNRNYAEIVGLISDPAFDVVVLVECPSTLSRSIRSGQEMTGTALVLAPPNPPYTQWVKLFSRWPMEAWEPEREHATGMLGAIVHHPDGAFGVVALHASSPWAPDRWRVGNRTIDDAAHMAGAMRASGLPVIVIGDFNATPLGARTSRLRREGLRRAKPALLGAGTFPAQTPWPLRIAIDDAMVGSAFVVEGWRTIALPGSDHAAVAIELRKRY